MAWQAPKIDWKGFTDKEGLYTGDRFNAADFNRIKNNIKHLHALAAVLYPDFLIYELGGDRTVQDYLYADEINLFEKNLIVINNNSLRLPYLKRAPFVDNGKTMTYADLNKWEKFCLSLYASFTLITEAGRRLPIRLNGGAF